MKILLVVLDGAGDRPVKTLAGMTPYEYADTPHLDFLASIGRVGLLHPVPGVAPESDIAVMSLLGYPPEKYTGRGPLEALGAGIRIRDGELALRCNIASSKDGKKLLDRRAGRKISRKEAREIESLLNKIKLPGFKLKFKMTAGHRGVLVIRRKDNKPLSDKITNTDPAYDKKGHYSVARSEYSMIVRKCKPLSKDAEPAARAVNQFTEKAYRALSRARFNKEREKKGMFPANMVLCRDAGNKIPNVLPLTKKYGKKFMIIADMPLEIGIARLAGMKVKKLSPGESAEAYKKRAVLAKQALKENDLVYVHLKGPDLYGHDSDCAGKAKSIEQIDKHFFGNLVTQTLLKKTIIAVTSDHSTPCKLGVHSADPVPLMIAGSITVPGPARKFGEKACSLGKLGRMRGIELMPFLMGLNKI